MNQSRRGFLAALGTVTGGIVTPGRAMARGPSEPDFDGYLDDANGYHGAPDDLRGKETVTVRVGAESQGEPYAFDPAGVYVDHGTTIRWEWTGKGGSHNVVNEEGTFESDLRDESGVHFEYTFESDGIYRYRCDPHVGLGMKGGIAVGDVPQRKVTPPPTATPTLTVTASGEWLDASPETDWTTFGYDAGNVGYRPDGEGPKNGVEEVGTIRFEKRFVRSPVLQDGTLFAVAGDEVHAVDATTGERRWKRAVGASTRPAVDGDRVYVGGHDDHPTFYALDPATSDVEWTFRPERAVVSRSGVADGSVFVGTRGSLHRLDAETGDERWGRTVGVPVGAPAVADGGVYFAVDAPESGTFGVRAVDADGGDDRWTFEADHRVTGPPAVVDGTVYVGTWANAVHAIDAEAGERRWTADTGSAVEGSPAVADGTVYVGCDDFAVYALDAATGKREWRTEFRGPVDSPAVVGGTVYAAVTRYVRWPWTHRAAVALDATTGGRRWRAKLEGGYEPAESDSTPERAAQSSTPVVTGDAVFVADGSRGIHILSGTGDDTAGERGVVPSLPVDVESRGTAAGLLALTLGGGWLWRRRRGGGGSRRPGDRVRSGNERDGK